MYKYTHLMYIHHLSIKNMFVYIFKDVLVQYQYLYFYSQYIFIR